MVLVAVEYLKLVLAVMSYVVVACFGSAVRQGAATYAVVMGGIRPFERGGDAPQKGGTSRVGAEWKAGWSACMYL